MGEFFTMIILVDTAKCTKTPTELAELFAKESKKLALEIRIQNEEIYRDAPNLKKLRPGIQSAGCFEYVEKQRIV